MRIVRVQVGAEVHRVTIQDRANSAGVKLLTCECGRSGWGWRSLQLAHERPAPIAIEPGPSAPPVVTWRDKSWWYNPMFDNRQERREHLAWSWWKTSAEKRRMRLTVRVGEKVLCGWYGHQESVMAPGVCYFCNKRRKRHRMGRRFARTWRPAPEREPTLRPGEGNNPTVIHGTVLRPKVCRSHRYTSYYTKHCPYCEMEH